MSAPTGLEDTFVSKTDVRVVVKIKCTSSGVSSTAMTYHIYGYAGQTTDPSLVTTFIKDVSGTAGSYTSNVIIDKLGGSSLTPGTPYTIKTVAENASGETAYVLGTYWLVPAAGTITIQNITPTSCYCRYSIDAYTGPMYHIQYSCYGPGDSAYYVYRTVTDNSAHTGNIGSYSSLTPNSGYTMYSRAQIRYTSTGALTSSTTKLFGFQTPPATPNVTISKVTPQSVTFAYTCPADGGYYTKEIQYSLDNGTTWTTAATVTGRAEKSGVLSIDNLQESTAYSVLVRAYTSAGSDTPVALDFFTKPSTQVFYGGVSSTASLSYSNYTDRVHVGITIDDTDELLAAIAAQVPPSELTNINGLTLTVEEI